MKHIGIIIRYLHEKLNYEATGRKILHQQVKG